MLMCGVAEAQKVSYDYNRNANFREFKTYAFKDNGQMSDNPFVNERIARAIAYQLQYRGMSRSNNPDVYITTNLDTQIRQEVIAWGAGWGYPGYYGPYGWGYAGYGWGGWWGGPTTYEVRDIRYDTLTINVTDAKTGKLLWRSTGTREVEPDWKPEKVTKKVNKTVAKMFKHYPYYSAAPTAATGTF
jgi:hypothetical protein